VAIVKQMSAVPKIVGNSSQLQQVFLNIMTNAIQAMPKGGSITISSRLTRFVPPGGADKVEGVEVNFTDSGVGIEDDHLTHVFEPFFTTKEIGKGTGLGLSVSLGIVRNHGGDIRAESAGQGKGATFRVLLPLSPAPAGINAEPVAQTVAAGSDPGTRFATGPNTRY
jgi:two-component system NtrC family sensor kinase